MHCTSSLLAGTLIVFSSVSPVIAVRPQIPEQWMKKRLDADKVAAKKFEKRDFVCYTDDTLSYLEAKSQDFTSFCSSFITEQDATSTSDVTSTTTTSVIYTTVAHTEGVLATIPSSTVLVTMTAAEQRRKRQVTVALTGAVPSTALLGPTDPGAIISSVSAACLAPTGLNLSLINEYSSACSCLIAPGVNTVKVTLTSTRTISGEDRAEYINTNTVTQGVTTVTVTVVSVASSLPSSGFSTYANSTISPIGGPTTPAGSVTSASGSPTTSTNSTVPSSPPLPGCPAANNTIYVSLGQTFLIQCDISYPGPYDQGLIVPSLHQCIDDCALVNVGFSQARCYATSFNPNLDPGTPDCFFKTHANSLLPFPNDSFISALLLNSTNTTLPSGTGIIPTGIISTGTGIVPSGPVYPTGTSLTPIGTTLVFPTLSINVTVSDNRTLVGPTGTGVLPSGTGVIPSGTGAIPSGTGIFPPTATGDTRTGVLPSGTGIVPSGTGITPSGTGINPSGTGIFPSGTGSANSTGCGRAETITATVTSYITSISTLAPHSAEVVSFVQTITI